MAIEIADLDHFKRINDRFGHDVGDKVIISAASALASGQAFAARLGGENLPCCSIPRTLQKRRSD